MNLEDINLDKVSKVIAVEKALHALCDDDRLDGWNGHYRSGADFYSPDWYEPASARIREMLGFVNLMRNSEEALDGILQAIREGKRLDTPIVLSRRMGSMGLRCPNCDEKLGLGFNGERFSVVSEKPCPSPNGLVTEFELNVPSGRLIVENDLRDLFPFFEDYNINTPFGRHLQSLEAATTGLAYGYVGNSSPGVYRTGDRFVIGSYEDEIWDGKSHNTNPKPCSWGEKVAGICTDLWWYSICDGDEFDRRVGAEKNYPTDPPVEVRPGVYRFRQESGRKSKRKFATFEWVREPDPVKDFSNLEKEHTATEVLLQSCIDWPTLYLPGLPKGGYDDRMAWGDLDREQKTLALASAANHIMCTLGNGIDWSKTGNPRTKVTAEVAQAAAEFGEVPLFDFQHRWYPISSWRGDWRFVDGAHMNNSFVRLALNVCYSNLKFGEVPERNNDVYPPEFTVDACRERMRIYARCYRDLRERHPEIVLEGAVFPEDLDTHVAVFDFGPRHPPKEKWGRKPLSFKTGEYFEFDANKMSSGHFAWHPSISGTWSSKSNAQRYALSLAGRHSNAGISVPLKTVGRVIQGAEIHKKTQLLVSFDYGTPDMLSKQWLIDEDECAYVRQFSDPVEYASLLDQAKIEFDESEDRILNPPKTSNYQFTECRVTSCDRETDRFLDDDGQLVDGDSEIRVKFYAQSRDKNGSKGYSHMPTVRITSETFGKPLDQIKAVGWQITNQTIRLVVRVGEDYHTTVFRLTKTAKTSGGDSWSRLGPSQRQRLKLMSLEQPNPVLSGMPAPTVARVRKSRVSLPKGKPKS